MGKRSFCPPRPTHGQRLCLTSEPPHPGFPCQHQPPPFPASPASARIRNGALWLYFQGIWVLISFHQLRPSLLRSNYTARSTRLRAPVANLGWGCRPGSPLPRRKGRWGEQTQPHRLSPCLPSFWGSPLHSQAAFGLPPLTVLGPGISISGGGCQAVAPSLWGDAGAGSQVPPPPLPGEETL